MARSRGVTIPLVSTFDPAGVIKAENRMASASRAMSKSADDMAGSFLRAGDRIGATGLKVQNFGGMVSGAGMALMPISGILLGIGAAAATMGIKAAVGFEQTQVAFETLLGSAEAGNELFDELKEFAKQTPFELPGILDGTKRLLAYGFAAEDVIPMLTNLGDAAAGLGLGTEGLNRMITAIGQINAKGKASAEEMRQLAEAGVPAWEFLAAKIGVSIPEAMKMAENGFIDADTTIAAIMEGSAGKFGGLMEEQAKTAGGAFSNMKDTVNIALAEAFEKNLPEITSALKDFTEAIGPAIEAAVPAISAALTALTPVIEKVSAALESFSEMTAEEQMGIMKIIGAVALAGPVLVTVGTVISAVGTIVTSVGAVISFLGGVVATVSAVFAAFSVGGIGAGFAAALAAIGGPVTLVIGAIVALIAAGVWLWKNWDTVKEKAAALVDWLGAKWDQLKAWAFEKFYKIGLAAITGFIRMRAGVIETATATVNWVKGLPQRFLDGLGNMANLLKNVGKSIIDGLWNGLKEKWENVKKWVGGLGTWIADHKGPIEVDRKLLMPAGDAIMGGFYNSLKSGFDPVRSLLGGFTTEIGGTSFGGFRPVAATGGSSSVTIAPGAITINLPAGTSSETARAAGDGVLDALARELMRR